MRAKKLNREQLLSLFYDILKQEVRKFGRYNFGKYFISVSTYRTTKEQREKRKDLYWVRKYEGSCVDCGSHAVRGITRCKRCQKRHNTWRNR